MESFLRLANLFPEPVLLVTAEGEVVAANRQACQELGAADPAGRPLAGLFADEAEKLAGYLRLCARSSEPVPGSLSFSDGNGGSVQFRANGAVYAPRSADGPPLVLLRLVEKERAVSQFLLLNERIEQLNREVSRRQRVEEELRQQREWLRVTLESIGDAVIATNMEGQTVFMNPAAQALTGWSQQEAVARPLTEIFNIINEETRLPAENPVAKVLREGMTAGLANHTVLISRDGREIPIEDCASPIRLPGGQILGVVMVFHDVVERRQLERELRARAQRLVEADRRKDEFLAMLAHELRNPLAPLLNSVHILGMPGVGADQVQRSRLTMERQIRHMVRLVDDLLDVSRITRAKIELRRERLELGALASLAAEAIRPVVEEAGLAFALHLPSEPLFLEADPTRLEQVLANLLHNAAKFTEPGGRVELSVERDGGEAVVTVRDTGIGIPADLLPHLFEPFVQGNPGIDRSKGGLGLGLTLVRTLVELHGGEVGARSEGPGRGSELTVRLPLAER